MRPSSFLLPVVLWILASGGVSGQAPEPPQHTLRILPLGDPPPFKQEIRGRVRYELPAEEGTVPPSSVGLAWAPPNGQEAPAPLPLRLRLGNASAPQKFPLPKDRKVALLSEGGEPWARMELAESAATLALVWKSGPKWDRAQALAIPEEPDGDLRRMVRFVNVTARPLGVTFEQEKLLLGPGKTLVRTLPAESRPSAVSIQYQGDDGKLQTCLSTQVDPSSRSFHQFILYAADGKDPRTPVKVLSFSEPK